MNDRYGVDPATPASRSDLVDLLRLFDPSEGRFVIGFPDDWDKRLRSRVGAYSDLGPKLADEAIERFRHVLLPSTLRYDEGRCWAENASMLKSREQVKLLIGPSGSPPTVTPLPKLMQEIQPLPTAREGRIDRSVSEYLTTVQPIFRTSPKVVMIDAWFSLHDEDGSVSRRRKVLAGFLVEAQRCGVRAFHLVVNPDKVFLGRRDPQGERRFREELAALTSELSCLEVFFDPRADCGHARYLLGNHSGLQFDHGFDIDDHLLPKSRKRNHVHWLTDEIVGSLLQAYGWPRAEVGREGRAGLRRTASR